MKKTLICLFVLIGLISKGQIKTVTEDQLFNAFKQDNVEFEGWFIRLGGGGNCASVALIKAAVGTFGINGVFKTVKFYDAEQKVIVTRHDGVHLILTYERLNHGKEHFFISPAKDELSKQISDYAAFCFAVMCRAKQLQMGNDKKYFYKAVDRLNKGQSAPEIYQLLGLKKEAINNLSVSNLKNYKNLVLYNAPHAVYSSSGNYDECFSPTITGIEPLTRLNSFHCRSGNCPILGAYILKTN